MNGNEERRNHQRHKRHKGADSICASCAFCGSFFSSVVFAIILSIPASAHHGTNISYDQKKPKTLTGTVTEFVFRNPHAQLYFDVKDENGNVAHWGGELNSPFNLRRDGWSKETFKPGDHITLTVFPARAGTAVGVVDRTKPVTVNGTELPGRTSSVD